MARRNRRPNRPKVNVNCWEDNFAYPNERIVHFEDRLARASGLISLRRVNDRLEVVFSELSPNVDVLVPPGHNLN